MRGLATVLSIALLVLSVSEATAADDLAATPTLPAVLEQIDAGAVVGNSEAHQIRATSNLWQELSFSVSGGVATGTTNLLEGVFGTFKYTDVGNGDESGSSVVTEGTFGGLTGTIGPGGEGLQFEMLGKGLQEIVEFAGQFDQDFSQGVDLCAWWW